MGVYYHLSCQACRQYVHFGKALHRENRKVLQGMYSEKTNQWIHDDRLWQAVQTFFFEHKDHPLCFGDDEHYPAMDDYVEIDVDHLLNLFDGTHIIGERLGK